MVGDVDTGPGERLKFMLPVQMLTGGSTIYVDVNACSAPTALPEIVAGLQIGEGRHTPDKPDAWRLQSAPGESGAEAQLWNKNDLATDAAALRKPVRFLNFRQFHGAGDWNLEVTASDVVGKLMEP